MGEQQPKEYIITEEQLDHFVTCAAHDDCTGCKYSAPEFVCVPRIMANKVRSRPAPQQPEPFVAMSSTDLIALSEKEWTNRAERKQPEYNKRSWISGWMDGYFSKPQQPPATTPACPYSAEEDMCLECKAHEERIAAKARREERERLLEPMEDLRKFANGEYNEADASDNEREMRIHLEYENRIWDIMKSLREGAP